MIAALRSVPRDGSCRSTSASSARSPPSPSLSAFSTSSTYLSEMTIVTAQKIIDSTPSTVSGALPIPWGPTRLSRNAYSGLVPMSPYTTPSAATTIAEACRFPVTCSLAMKCGSLLRGRDGRSGGGRDGAKRRALARVHPAEHLERVFVSLPHDLVEARPLQQTHLVQRRAEVHVGLAARLVLPRGAVQDGHVEQVRRQRRQAIAALGTRTETIAQQRPAARHVAELELARVPRAEIDAEHLADAAQVAHPIDREVVEGAAVAQQVAVRDHRRQR